jgi:hypothetical protein
MTPDTAQGVSAELNFILKEGWSFVKVPSGFRVSPPSGSGSDPSFLRLLEQEVWRVAQFVAYADFVSIARHADRSYTVVSRSASGLSFELVFATT